MNVNVRRAALWLALAGLLAAWIGSSVAKPPEGKGKPGGGGGESYAGCVLFSDRGGDAIQNDETGVPYCNSSRDKILVSIRGGNDPGFRFDSNTSNKASAGRTVLISFDEPEFAECGHGMPVWRVGSESREVDFRIQSEYKPDGAGGWTAIGSGRLDMLSMAVPSFTYAGLTSGPLLNFDPNPPGPFGCVLADAVLVTRDAVDQWTIATVPGADRAASFDVIDNDWNNPVFRGVYHMPFEMTVTVLP